MRGHGKRSANQRQDQSSSHFITPSGRRWSHGNFVDYYSRRREAVKDLRVDAIAAFLETRLGSARKNDDGTIRSKTRMLDVGCNAGNVAFGLCHALSSGVRQDFVLGVDVDEVLVRNARARANLEDQQDESNGASKSRAHNQVKNPYLQHHDDDAILTQPKKRLRLDATLLEASAQHDTEEKERKTEFKFCNVDWVYNDQAGAAASESGKIPAEEVEKNGDQHENGNDDEHFQERNSFPAFHISQVQQSDDEKYDVILALSVTKWIHMHMHDVGVRRFFARLSACLAPGGFLILEPQPWKSYEQARREVSKEVRTNGRTLRVRPEDFEWLLCCEFGLLGPFVLARQGQSGALSSAQGQMGTFSRDLLAFQKPCADQEWAISRATAEERIETLLRLPRFDTQTRQDPDVDMAWVARGQLRKHKGDDE